MTERLAELVGEPRAAAPGTPHVHAANGCAMRRPRVARAAPVGRRRERTPSPRATTRSPRLRSQGVAGLSASLPTAKAPSSQPP